MSLLLYFSYCHTLLRIKNYDILKYWFTTLGPDPPQGCDALISKGVRKLCKNNIQLASHFIHICEERYYFFKFGLLFNISS